MQDSKAIIVNHPLPAEEVVEKCAKFGAILFITSAGPTLIFSGLPSVYESLARLGTSQLPTYSEPGIYSFFTDDFGKAVLDLVDCGLSVGRE